jgi:excisionase family DNA binding protein
VSDSHSGSDRLSFAQACQELKVSEEELERLIANGEIASVKEGDSFFFKPEAVAQFRRSRQTEPAIILSDDEMDLLDDVDEINLDDLESPSATNEVSVGDSASDELDLDEWSLDDDDDKTSEAADGGDDTVLNLDGLLDDSDVEGTTPVPAGDLELDSDDDDSGILLEEDLVEETILDTDVLDLTDEDDTFDLEDDEGGEDSASTLIRSGGARVMQMKRVRSHGLWTVLLVLTAFVMFIPLAVMVNLFYYDSNVPREPVAAQARPGPTWIADYNFLRGGVEAVASAVTDALPTR